VLHLVTGRAPPEFMTDAGRLEVPATLPCDEPLRGVLVRLLAAAPTERFQSARETRVALFASPSGDASTAVAPAGRSASLATREPIPASRAVALGPVPRPLTGETQRLLRQVGHSTWELMSPTEKPGTPWGVTHWLLTGFFSVLTAGVLPALFWHVSRSRKNRLRPFLINGLPATAYIVDMTSESIGFDVSMTRVRYEFEADGQVHRDSDQALPSISGRWAVGTPIQILFLPDERYDSVIISTS
ncbi:MAG: hypothetical protein K0S86_2995, partial [Geminicoccaceae bacterium]|nr:hypothetical protein [Geminicoccaceae bacterium]